MRKPFLLGLVIVALAALGLAAYSLGVLARGVPELHGTELDQPPSVGDVRLQAGQGNSVRLADYAGRYLVVFFGYTNCPDVCPLTMARLGSAFRALGEPEDLQVVMVTVDPERDTPDVIDAYARRFHPAFDGLGGTREQVDAAAGRFFIGHRDPGDGNVIHGSQVLLVDPDSRLWRVYNDESQLYLEDDLRKLLGSAG
ncbi:MAG: SCO family protein [Trueperaceae bacterium]